MYGQRVALQAKSEDEAVVSAVDRQSSDIINLVTLLYEAEMKGRSASMVLDELTLAPEPMAAELVVGVDDHQLELDEQISAALDAKWSLARLSVIDRIVLRLATYELMYREQVPTGAAINEAVDIARQFSGPEAGRFVNGVLSGVARAVR